MEKINGTTPPKNCIKDELDYLLQNYTSEEIKELFKSAIPKWDKEHFKLPIIYGTP